MVCFNLMLSFSITHALLFLSLSISTTQTAFTTKKNYGGEERMAQWATTQRSLHGLPVTEPEAGGRRSGSFVELSEVAEQARRRAEFARLREKNTLRGQLESSARLRGVDLNAIKSPFYSV
jgi:H+-transporting ATPase